MNYFQRRKLILSVALVVTGLLALVLTIGTVLHRSTTGVRKKLESIEAGISRADIVNKLGVPAGDYTKRPYAPMPNMSKFAQCEGWLFDEGLLLVRFDDQDQAIHVYLFEVHPMDRGIAQRFRAWLGF